MESIKRVVIEYEGDRQATVNGDHIHSEVFIPVRENDGVEFPDISDGALMRETCEQRINRTTQDLALSNWNQLNPIARIGRFALIELRCSLA